MYLRSDEKAIGKENFLAATGSKAFRRQVLQDAIRQGLTPAKGLRPFYFKYDKQLDKKLVVGLIGVGQQGSRLLAALNPAYITVKSIADIRPSNQANAVTALVKVFKGKELKVLEPSSTAPDAVKAAAKEANDKSAEEYKKAEEELKNDVKIYEGYQKLIEAAKADGLEAVIIALPSHLHGPAALAAMQAGLHVFVETPMALAVAQAKEMVRTATEKKLCLAVGQQRRYSMVYDNALEMVRKGLLDDVHYLRAQWHMPLPEKKSEDKAAKKPAKKGAKPEAPKGGWWSDVPAADAEVKAKDHGYDSVEALVRWQLWEKLSGGMFLELGYHLFETAAMVIQSMPNSDKERLYPLSVAASASQLFSTLGGDIDDHVECLLEFAVDKYVDKGPQKARKKIGLQYDMIVGNEFDGYGETILGKQGSLVLENEQNGMLYKTSNVADKIRVVQKDETARPTLDIPKDGPKTGDEESAAIARLALQGSDAGYAAELEHWACCCRNPSSSKPRGTPETGLTATVLAVTAAQAARLSATADAKINTRIDFKKEWFDAESKETPDNIAAELTKK